MASTFRNYAITIDGGSLGGDEATQSEFSIRLTLERIARSDTGTALLERMRLTGRSLTILPWTDTKINATASPSDPKAATRKGEFALAGGKGPQRFMPMTEGLFIKEPMVGTGVGSDSVIRFSPFLFGYGGTASKGPKPEIPAGSPGTTPSAVLFHEMAHSYRHMSGQYQKMPLQGGRAGYNNEEEFFAIVLSNIFVTDPTSEILRRTLRADHRGFNQLAPALSTSKGFLSEKPNERLIGKIGSQEPGLMLDLLKVRATFNPFKEYFRPGR